MLSPSARRCTPKQFTVIYKLFKLFKLFEKRAPQRLARMPVADRAHRDCPLVNRTEEDRGPDSGADWLRTSAEQIRSPIGVDVAPIGLQKGINETANPFGWKERQDNRSALFSGQGAQRRIII